MIEKFVDGENGRRKDPVPRAFSPPERPPEPDQEEERQLLHDAQSGDNAAVEQLLKQHQGALYRYARRMCHNPEDAEDVLQESLLAAATNLANFRGESRFSTWMFTIARRNCLRKARRSKFAPDRVESLHTQENVANPSLPGPETELEQTELRGALESAINTLDDTNREILVLRDVEGLSALEVGKVLNMTTPQIKSRLHRARVALRQAVAPHFSPRLPTCPDIDTAFSQFMEGEISANMCSELQAHVEGCPHCQARCSVLKDTLAVCHTAPVPRVPQKIQEAVRKALRAELLP